MKPFAFAIIFALLFQLFQCKENYYYGGISYQAYYQSLQHLNETLEVGTDFLQVVANDPDTGKNGRLTYHIVHPDSYASHFALHPDTGWMRTRASLRCRTKRQVCLLLKSC